MVAAIIDPQKLQISFSYVPPSSLQGAVNQENTNVMDTVIRCLCQVSGHSSLSSLAWC